MSDDRMAQALPAAITAPAAEPARATGHRPLPEGRFTGPMPFLIAVMMFLMVLAAALGIALTRAASGMDAAIEGRITVQILQPDPALRERQATRAVAALAEMPGIARVSRVDDEALGALLEPWLGQGGTAGADLPVPAMIDVDLAADGADAGAIARALAPVAPSARIDDHAGALAPILGTIGLLGWLAVGIVLLTTAATAFVVVLATRAALDTHSATIEVLHLLGATDPQVAKLFQRRIGIDALVGALAGTGAALLVVVLVATRINRLGSELAGGASLGWLGWGLLIALPFAAALLARFAAARTVLTVLSRVP